MHNKISNKYYFINKFDQSHIDKQDKDTTIIYRNYNQKHNEQNILSIKKFCIATRKKFYLAKKRNLKKNFFINTA